MSNADFYNALIGVFVKQLMSFQDTLADDERVAIIIDGNSVVIDRLEMFPSIGRIAVWGQIAIAMSPLENQAKSVFLLAVSPSTLKLTAVKSTAAETRKPVGILNWKEPAQD